jgi:cell division protein YceG involved in septum cleavage
MILRQSPRPTPAQLSHHTSLDALYSILGETEGPGVCFRAVSNKYKNDAEELKMGEYMLEKVRSVLSHSMLHQIKGYEDSASISFMEGETTGYMLNEYGNCRLDFDLRTLNRGYFDGHLMDCEYIQKDNLKQFADEYVQRMLNILQEIKNLQQKHGTNSCEAVALLPEFVMINT